MQDHGWTMAENHIKSTDEDGTYIDIKPAMDDFNQWRNTNLPQHDHVILWTG